jgi:outer membrane protein assembly factor BamE (lipoprotein component of BamABCDE complex)
MQKYILSIILVVLSISLSSCSSSDSENASSVLEDLPSAFFDSREVNTVKNGSV